MRKLSISILLALSLLVVASASASALTPRPGWEVTQATFPTNLQPGQEGTLEVSIYNVGAEPNEVFNQVGDVTGVLPFTVSDVLPVGVSLVRAVYVRDPIVFQPSIKEEEEPRCSTGVVVACTISHPVYPGEPVRLRLTLSVAGSASGTVTNAVTVSGGGAVAPASDSQPVTLSASEPSHLGIEGMDDWFSNAEGVTDTQAGSHPYEFTTEFTLDNEPGGPTGVRLADGEEMRNVEFRAPPGLIGDPAALAQCPRQQFDVSFGEDITCPLATQIGIDVFSKKRPGGGVLTESFPLYNMVPPPGMPAQFAGSIAGENLFLDAAVRSGGDYGITEHVDNIPQYNIISNVVTLWGVPAESSHNTQRGGTCLAQEFGLEEERGEPVEECVSGTALTPFLTLPTSCGAPPVFAMNVNSWQNGDQLAETSSTMHDQSGNPVGITGCEHLSVAPTISSAPDTSAADTPAGLTFEVKVPEEGLTASAEGHYGSTESLAPADLQATTVTLPEGVVINPGQAVGLAACQEAEERLHAEGEGSEATCPNASKVGTDSAVSPLLSAPLEGNVYVLQSNPPELKLLAVLAGDGVEVKLVLNVHLDEQTGQLTTRVENIPEFPITDFKLAFSGGAQAALDTPTGCGTYTTTTDFTPSSSPFTPDIFPESSFLIDGGPGGGACPSAPLPFSPSLVAGATTDQAGGYTDFSLLLQRGDDQQRIDGLQFKAPEGLTGELANVPLCTNAQAEANACPEASKIGHTVVEAGPGPYPLVVPEPGQAPAPIYLTEAYDGAPFGLSIVVPLHVGPFVLPTQRVRARIEVNPYTSALTVTTNPLPQEVAGVPTDLREVDAVIERPEFMVNPTNCKPQEFSGTAYGTPPPGQAGSGATAPISSHFQVGACRALEFAPKFSVSTSGKTSKADGASLTAKVTYPSVPQGTDADIAAVKVDLPKQLPSRLTTLQKACTNAQFELNPANCPAASKIGHAVVHTPLLPVLLEGPAIFVSHGGEAFPSLTIVLQGDGVTVDLVGTTFISKAGITSTTFKTVPDDPFSTFELVLPEGPYSALAANGNLCTSKLAMPTAFVGQNGAEIHETTAIGVTGCAKVKALTRAQKLTKALKACRKKAKGKRAACEANARRQYGPVGGKKGAREKK